MILSKKCVYTFIFLSLLNRVLGVLPCLRALRVYVLACSRTWCVCVLTCLACLGVSVLTCFRACMLPCFHASVLGVLGMLACLAYLHAYVLAMMKCFTFLCVSVLGILTFLSNYLLCLHKSRLCN